MNNVKKEAVVNDAVVKLVLAAQKAGMRSNPRAYGVGIRSTSRSAGIHRAVKVS